MDGTDDTVDEAADEEEEDVKVSPRKTSGLWKLYISRALTAWGDRLWAFGLGLFLLRVWPQDLLIVAIYGLVNCIASILSGALIGNWIDDTARLKAAKTFLVVQNSSVALACLVLAAFFHWKSWWSELLGSEEAASLTIAILTISIAIVSTLASMGSKIVVEKDWIVVIAGGDSNKLASMNSIFRTIDLVCLTLTPTLAGLLFTYSSYLICAIFIGVWNAISVFLEFLLLVSIYQEFSALSHVKPEASDGKKLKGPLSSVTGSVKGWKTYFTHHTLFAGLGLAFLFMTVLGFDSITWAFILMQCVEESLLGGLVAISALVGVLGATAFPPLRKLLGVERAGVAGMTLLVSALTACVASIWLPGSPFDPTAEEPDVFDKTTTTIMPLTSSSSNSTSQNGEAEDVWDCAANPPDVTSVAVLLTGIITARFGLWLADLSINQVQQEQVEEEHRGVIGGVQSALQQLFDMTKFLLVIFMPNPHMFGILILLSFIFVTLGAIFMTAYAGLKGKLNCCGSYKATNTQEPDLSLPD